MKLPSIMVATLLAAMPARIERGAPAVQQPIRTGTIRGVAFDSLLLAPAAGAVVWIPGLPQTAVADANGRFTLAAVPAGKQFVAFSSPSLDSLGLNILGASVDVHASKEETVKLFTPAFPRIWQTLCGDVPKASPDSGIVWGTVRDAATDQRLSGARANFTWFDMHVEDNTRVQEDVASRDVRTDSTATYYACGMPTDVALHARADGAHATSGTVQYTIGERRVRRLDLLVSAEMVAPGSEPLTNLSGTATKLRGTAVIRGVVADERNAPIANVEVSFVSLDTTVRTSETGEFILAKLPAGTHDIEFAGIGYSPSRLAIGLHPDSTISVTASLTSLQTLAAMNVHAIDRRTIADRLDFEFRRKSGFGYSFDEKDFAKAPNVSVILSGVPGAMMGNNGVLGMRRISLSGGSGVCSPIIWIDGRRTDPKFISELQMSDLRGIEVYTHAGSAPPMYVGSQACGVVLYWTRFARW